jgi:hypothetical protein
LPLTVTDRITAAAPAFGVALRARLAVRARHHGPGRRRAESGQAVGIRNGPSYTQIRLGPDGPGVMEVAARLGGGHDAELCAAAPAST